MKKLSKEWAKNRDEIIAKLEVAADKVNTEIEEYNHLIEDVGQRVTVAVGEYNELIGEAEAVIEDAKQEIRDYIDNRSVTWQEGERGQRYEAWYDELDSLSVPSLDVVIPEPIEMPDFEARDVLTDDFPDELTE